MKAFRHVIGTLAVAAAVAGVLSLANLLPVIEAGPQVATQLSARRTVPSVWANTRAFDQDNQSLAPYVPTPQEVVDRMSWSTRERTCGS